MIKKRPYKLFNKIQNYAWGTKNDSAFIPQFLGMEFEPGLPYAELWIGAHPKSPSEIIIDGQKIKLNELIDKFPKQLLGVYISEKFNNELPFLLKVLSAGTALSIQAHPDKKLAKVLHQKDPKNYPDENHKPEIAITLDTLSAVVGFRPFEEIEKVLSDYQILKELIEPDILNKESNSESDREAFVKMVYESIMKADQNKIEIIIEEIRRTILKRHSPDNNEQQFLLQYENYGCDIGLISILLFNLIELSENDAIFTGAGIPHAYIKGNIVECMANSDNVIRAGLTPKFKDIDTLVEMLDYKLAVPPITQRNSDVCFEYTTSAEEFQVKSFQFRPGDSLNFESKNRISIILITEGEVEFKTEIDSQNFRKGESILIPAILENFKITSISRSHLFEISVP
ncbi:MAG: mannose-6-phosphate isomerase, class I [Melioribacteraceae bacterium]|nr:mannose-6-phosphate isomerase, class I [Melioribacteraceae bacterium]MCF8265702.1 mannose-6-phosphate isomerase, class I [Melioribacteraceae bacterium]